MKNKKAIIGLGAIATLLFGVASSIAYLSDEQTNANVMTVGNVKIEQLEYERVVENGKWIPTGKEDKYGYTPDKIQKFTQNKSLSPAVFKDGNIKWDDRVSGHQQSWAQIGAPGSNQLFDDSVRNALDKFVFVKNIGKKDAYIRTWFAFEQGSIPSDKFETIISTNGDATHWKWETVATDVKIGGNEYVIAKATYLGPTSNPTGILTPDATTYPSLLQVYMKPSATNEDVEDIDGNNNGTYDILVVSQAVQTDGFDSAEEALTAAFTNVHPWNDLTIAQANDEVSTSLDGDLYLIDRPYYNEYKDVEENLVIDGNGHTVYQEVSSKEKFVFGDAEPYTGNRSKMGNLFVSKASSNITIKDITFKGTTQGIQLGYWDGPCDFNATLENVNIVDLAVAADYHSDEVTKLPKGNGVLIYGNATLDNVRITGTRNSSLYTDNYDVYDLVVINGNTTIKDSKIGTIRAWKTANITVSGNTVIDLLELSFVKSSKSQTGTITVEDGATIKKVIVRGQEMTFEEWLNS